MHDVAERATVQPPSGKTDFMSQGYDLNGEPLRLHGRSRQWLAGILRNSCKSGVEASALLLGASPWLLELLSPQVEQTIVVDISRAMLNLCARSTTDRHIRASRRVELMECNWLALPKTVREVDMVVGDNALSFLRYPDGWAQLLDLLVERMTKDAVLISRFLSVRANHRSRSPKEIVQEVLRRKGGVNLTAVRTALLLAHWDRSVACIRPEAALATFEGNRSDFEPLLCSTAKGSRNDLLSIEKYRGTNLRYFVPLLSDALAMFEDRFRVRAVHFGPYEMSEYFPLIVASKSPRCY